MSWTDLAACNTPAGRELDWFPSADAPGGVTASYRANLAACRALCAVCPVSEQCKQDAFTHDTYGVWAALTRTERKLLGASARPHKATCGTTGGYARHRRLGEEPCTACRNAHARSARDRNRRYRLSQQEARA